MYTYMVAQRYPAHGINKRYQNKSVKKVDGSNILSWEYLQKKKKAKKFNLQLGIISWKLTPSFQVANVLRSLSKISLENRAVRGPWCLVTSTLPRWGRDRKNSMDF